MEEVKNGCKVKKCNVTPNGMLLDSAQIIDIESDSTPFLESHWIRHQLYTVTNRIPHHLSDISPDSTPIVDCIVGFLTN